MQNRRLYTKLYLSVGEAERPIRAAHALARWSLLNFVLGCFDPLRGPLHFVLSISQDLDSVLDVSRS